jgi:lipopolysaccharide assembly protein A
MTNLVVSAITAFWIALIALVSVQNASLVSLKFVLWKSIELPWGIVLAGAVAIGLMIGACLPLIGRKSPALRRK